MIEVRDVDIPGNARVRVTVTRELESINDPRDWNEMLSDDDLSAWLRDNWQYVTVTVESQHYCDTCRTWHVGTDGDSLGMVALGSGDGWTVTVDDLFTTYPVPDMITELRKGE